MNVPTTAQPNEAGRYEIRLQGRIAPQWSSWLDGMTVTSLADGTTAVTGHVIDQAALHGLLARLRDLGLPLLSVVRIDPHTTQQGD